MKMRISFFMLTLSLFCMTICFFPHLFPEFVAYAMTPDNLETSLSDNLPETEDVPVETSNFPNPMQKEAAQLAGYALYWAVVGFSVAFSTCGLIWFWSGASQC